MSAPDLTPFEDVVAGLVVSSPWAAMWVEAEDTLREAHPEGYDVLEIGRMAWDCLPDDEMREAALDELFYAWWEREQDRKASTKQAGGAL